MTASDSSQPPTTGVPRIDEALAELDLGEDVTTHPAALASALEALQQALNQP